MENDKLLSMIGLCKKADRLVQGNEAVKEAVLNGKVNLVLIAKDISAGTRKGLEDVAGYTQTPLEVIPVTIQDLGDKTGKKAGIIGIADRGFASAIRKIIQAI